MNIQKKKEPYNFYAIVQKGYKNMATIMLCDDAAFMRLTLKKIVERAGHKVVAEGNRGSRKLGYFPAGNCSYGYYHAGNGRHCCRKRN